MLWSLIKITLFVGIVGFLAWGAGYLLEVDGGMTIRGFGYEVSRAR